MEMEYIIYIETDFGELKVCFETDKILLDDKEVLKKALEKVESSKDIVLTGLLKRRIYWDITEGETKYY